MAHTLPPKILFSEAGAGESARPRASSVGSKLMTRRVRRTSGTYPSPLSPYSPESEADAGLYCVCRQPYNKQRDMVQCDRCEDWFHPTCVGLRDVTCIPADVPYFCPNCDASTPTRPRSACGNFGEEQQPGGRPRSLSQSRKRPKTKTHGLAASVLDPSRHPNSDMVDAAGVSLPATELRQIKQEAGSRDYASMSSSLPTYLHTNGMHALRPRGVATPELPEAEQDSWSSGKLGRLRTRTLEEHETDEADASEHDGFGSPSDGLLRSQYGRRRRKPTPFLPGLESLSIHNEANAGYVVSGCPNRTNAFHTCTSYCACRWGRFGGSLRDEDTHAGAYAHDGSDHKRVFHNERERVRRSTIRTMFELLRRSVPAIEAQESASDRHILVEAARHIQSLIDEGKDLERGVMQLRVENLRLRLSQLPPGDPIYGALTAQLAAAMCAVDVADGDVLFLAGNDPLSIPYGPSQRPDDCSSGVSSSDGCRDGLESLLEIAEKEYADTLA